MRQPTGPERADSSARSGTHRRQAGSSAESGQPRWKVAVVLVGSLASMVAGMATAAVVAPGSGTAVAADGATQFVSFFSGGSATGDGIEGLSADDLVQGGSGSGPVVDGLTGATQGVAGLTGIAGLARNPEASSQPSTAVETEGVQTTGGQLTDLAPTQSITPSPTPSATIDPSPSATEELPVRTDALTTADELAGLLSVEVPQSAGLELVTVAGSDVVPDGATVRTVRVEVERDLPVDGDAFATFVMGVLNDPRGWGAADGVTFVRVDGVADLRIVLASPDMTDEMCAPLTTAGAYSCAQKGRAVINFYRWVNGQPEFPSLTSYRQFAVNHQVGQLLGKPTAKCGGIGELAPVMQQQTRQVAPCVANPWPNP